MNAKLVILLFAALIAIVSGAVLGGPKSSNDVESVNLLSTDLQKLANCGGPQYTVNQIYSITKKVVSGLIRHYQADLINADKCIVTCSIDIWSKPWAKLEQITLDCEESNKLVKNVNSC